MTALTPAQAAQVLATRRALVRLGCKTRVLDAQARAREEVVLWIRP